MAVGVDACPDAAVRHSGSFVAFRDARRYSQHQQVPGPPRLIAHAPGESRHFVFVNDLRGAVEDDLNAVGTLGY